MPYTDETHDPALTSWAPGANDPSGDFPVQNLPLGVFQAAAGEPRIGTAIGTSVLDLRAVAEQKLLPGLSPEAACALCAPRLNDFLGLGRPQWTAVRQALSAALRSDADAGTRAALEPHLHPAAGVTMLMPVAVGDYTDFYASLHHATNVGSMFRPDNPLMPNYKHLPVGYHGRASSIVASGAPVVRPHGQTKGDDAPAPTYGPCKLLDYELEMGVFTGPGNPMGWPVKMSAAVDHLFGMVIVNDWSARDVQKWEYQPLGPFNAKNFVTTISPWIVTLEALGPYRVAGPPRGEDDPAMLDYLKPVDDMAIDVTVEVYLSSVAMRELDMPPVQVSHGSFRDMYWTFAQMLAHHTSTGCNMRPGDLLASGTVSGPNEDNRGCLLERTWRGQNPIELPDGTQRRFLQDDDEVTITAYCQREGAARIGFGECRGIVQPAHE